MQAYMLIKAIMRTQLFQRRRRSPLLDMGQQRLKQQLVPTVCIEGLIMLVLHAIIAFQDEPLMSGSMSTYEPLVPEGTF